MCEIESQNKVFGRIPEILPFHDAGNIRRIDNITFRDTFLRGPRLWVKAVGLHVERGVYSRDLVHAVPLEASCTIDAETFGVRCIRCKAAIAAKLNTIDLAMAENVPRGDVSSLRGAVVESRETERVYCDGPSILWKHDRGVCQAPKVTGKLGLQMTVG